MNFREIEKIIKDDDWYLTAIKGSHYHYKHSKKEGKITIPLHSTGKDINPDTIKSIKKQAGL